MAGVYNLGFITDEAIYAHVKWIVKRYRTHINLEEFNQNIIDPIKLTFDSKVYGQTMEQVVESECIRQIDKSNTNHIGFFHQYLFKYAGFDWDVPEVGFDVVNEARHIYVEMKNKHNTMNSASSQKTYMKMQAQLLQDDQATCYLVEAIATKSQNVAWSVKVDGKNFKHEKIRRISMDKFYEIVFGDAMAFYKLCAALPKILDDVIAEVHNTGIQNSVNAELAEISPDLVKSLYLLAFKTYEGFDNL